MRRAISARLKRKNSNKTQLSPTVTLPPPNNDLTQSPACTICEFGSERSRIGTAMKQTPSITFASLTTQAGRFGSSVVPPLELDEDAVSEAAISVYSRPIVDGRWKNMEVDLVSFLTFTKQRIKDKHVNLALLCSPKGLLAGDFDEGKISTIAQRVLPSVKVHIIPTGYAAYLSAKTSSTALMVDLGESATTLSVIVNNEHNLKDTIFFQVGGDHLSKFMADLIRNQLPEDKQGPVSHVIAKHVKEKLIQACNEIESELTVHGYDPRIDIHILRLSLDSNSFISLLPPDTLDTTMDFLEPKFKTLDAIFEMGWAKFRRSQVHLKKIEIRCQSSRGILTREILKLGIERFLCAELLFRPEIGGIKSQGLHHVISELAEKKSNGNEEIKNQILGNIILFGGGSRISGLDSRLKKELQTLHPDVRINVKIHPDGDAACYVGGTCWATINLMKDDQPSSSIP
eukprot:TRINITY_DN5354_c0_g1_i1.p1 TRINITY_DN5354_c0_g1~~TRINITY_DN5354_c0_g1_i1.p1  ORF type:complete len:458 (-),score=126.88 TRINITY_DN5354_c0_g1_i1:126-1499(-)